MWLLKSMPAILVVHTWEPPCQAFLTNMEVKIHKGSICLFHPLGWFLVLSQNALHPKKYHQLAVLPPPDSILLVLGPNTLYDTFTTTSAGVMSLKDWPIVHLPKCTAGHFYSEIIPMKTRGTNHCNVYAATFCWKSFISLLMFGIC